MFLYNNTYNIHVYISFMNPSDTCNPRLQFREFFPHMGRPKFCLESCEEKATKHNDWYRNVQTFIGIFGFIWFWSHVLPVFFLSSHGWQISWKHVSPACKHANFLEPRTTQNQSLHCHCRGPNMKLVSKSGFWQVNVANKEFKSDLWPPTCHLLTPESILSSSYTSEMALDQVIVTLDSINVRMCDATVAACTFWLKHFIKELTVASVTWVT